MIKPLNQFLTAIDKPSDADGFLVIKNLFKSYATADGREAVILNDIDLTIGENEYVSVIGHSGCGKSTLLKILAGLEKSTAGSVRLEGNEIRKPGAERMMVFQHYSLLPWLTARGNIRLAVDEVLEHIPSQEKRRIVDERCEIIDVPFSHPRNPQEIRKSREYYELRNHALNFLDEHFTQDD